MSVLVRPRPRDLRRAALVAAAVLTLIALAAGVTAVGFAASARHALDFGFAGVPDRLGEAWTIFVANARLMGAIAAAAVVVQSLRLEHPGAPLGRGGRGVRLACDLVLGIAVAENAAIVGVSVGAYGTRMVGAMLPHGPLELAAYAAALALYLRAREAPLSARPAARLAAWAVSLLALAALLETFVA